MLKRSGAARVALTAMATAATLFACSAAALLTASCGIRVSSTDFAAFRLSEPTAADTTASIREARPAAR